MLLPINYGHLLDFYLHLNFDFQFVLNFHYCHFVRYLVLDFAHSVVYHLDHRSVHSLADYFVKIIEDELNVKKVSFTDDVSAYTDYTFKPQLRTVGPKYGKYLKQIQTELAQLDGNAAMNELRKNGVIRLDSIGENVVLSEEDLLITMTQMEGYMTEGDNFITVVLDTNLTAELIEEGFVRELISKIQTMRKEAGFEVVDRIYVYQDNNKKLAEILKVHENEIKAVVLAEQIFIGQKNGYVKEWDINGESTILGVAKVL